MKLLALLIITAFLGGCSGRENGDDDHEHQRVYYSHDEFAMGADLSYVNQILDHGGTYRDSGVVQDPYQIFSEYGANTVRLRLFHNPQWIKENYDPPLDHMYNDLADVTGTISLCKELGMAVCLDFHYSDSWADPSKQVPPAAWSGLTLTDLHDSLYNYTFKTLNRLNDAGLMPEYVQLGNEINPGFLLPQGDRWNKKTDFIYLMNAAIKAVRDASSASAIKPKIILHVAKPEQTAAWFQGMAASGLTDFDIVGVSYYYMWSDVFIDNLSGSLYQIKSQTGKEVMIMETCYPWTTGYADAYNNIISPEKIITSRYPSTPEGQYDYLVKLTQEIIDAGGSGIFYWEPAWITSQLKDGWGTGSSWECNTLFDFDGDVISGMDFMTAEYEFVKR